MAIIIIVGSGRWIVNVEFMKGGRGVDFKGTNAGDRGLGVVFWIEVHVRVVIATVMYGVICKHYFWGEGQDVLIGLQRVLVVVVINPQTFLGGVDVGGLLLGGVNGVLSYTLLCEAACKNVTSMLFHCNVVGDGTLSSAVPWVGMVANQWR